MSREPRYSKAETKARRAEVEQLRTRAVKDWNRDRVGRTALVLLTFEEYLHLITLKNTATRKKIKT